MDVLDEVEDLFKKLATVPADIKDAALKKICENLSKVDKKRRIELPSRRSCSRRQKKEEIELRGEFIEDFVVESVLTSRGRKAQRICYAHIKQRQNSQEKQKNDSSTQDNILTKMNAEQISLEDTYGALHEDLIIDEKCSQNDDVSKIGSEKGETVQEESSKVNVPEDDIKLENSFEESPLVIADPPVISVDLIEPRAFSSNEEMNKYFSSFHKTGKKKNKKTIESGNGSFRKEKQRPFTCHLCSFQTLNRIQFRSHHRKHVGLCSYKCRICGKTFCQSTSLRVHLKRHCGQRDFPCDYGCNYRAYTKGDKIRHMTKHTGERRHQCQYCGKQFTKDTTLYEHLKSIHERRNKHICPTCGFSTYRANNLQVHISMRHRGQYNHVCPVCGMKVKKRAPFLDHVRSHTGERPYKCPLCESAFTCVARLNVHRKSVHGPREFHCKHCQKCFQTKYHMERHELIHTNKKPFDCPFCSYSCNAQGNVTKHVKNVHNKPDFSYRKYRTDQQADSDCKMLKSEWIEKGEKVTKEYLRDLSKKVGREVTVSELQELEAKKKKSLAENVGLVKKQYSRKKEHDYHSQVCPDDDLLEEEEVDEPLPVMLNMAESLSTSPINNVMGETACSLSQTHVLNDVPNNPISNTQTVFLQHDPEINSLQPVLSACVKKESELDTPLLSGQKIEFLNMNEPIQLEEVRVIYRSQPASNTPQGNASPDSSDPEYINNLNFVDVNSDAASSKTVVVIINTENH